MRIKSGQRQGTIVRRREVLAALAGVGTAGCVTGYTGTDRDPPGTAAGDTKYETLPLAQQGVPPTICEERLRPEGIRAISDPAFGSPDEYPADTEGYRPLTDDATVIGLVGDGVARAYPLTVLNVHEIVNDTLPGGSSGNEGTPAADGAPLIVTYCPICRSGMVANRRVDGAPTVFDASGLLWKPPRINTAAAEADDRVFSDRPEGVGNGGNLVMYDAATGSYWSQMLSQAICGPQRGTRLSLRPATITGFGDWQDAHPETEVLLPPPRSEQVLPPVGDDPG